MCTPNTVLTIQSKFVVKYYHLKKQYKVQCTWMIEEDESESMKCFCWRWASFFDRVRCQFDGNCFIPNVIRDL